MERKESGLLMAGKVETVNIPGVEEEGGFDKLSTHLEFWGHEFSENSHNM